MHLKPDWAALAAPVAAALAGCDPTDDVVTIGADGKASGSAIADDPRAVAHSGK